MTQSSSSIRLPQFLLRRSMTVTYLEEILPSPDATMEAHLGSNFGESLIPCIVDGQQTRRSGWVLFLMIGAMHMEDQPGNEGRGVGKGV